MDRRETEGRATVGAGQLYTPTEPYIHSFSPDKSKAEETTKLQPLRTTPPVSPEDRTLPSFTATIPHPSDEPLFPESASTESQEPLFDSQSEHTEESLSQAATATSPQSDRHLPATSDLPCVPGTQIRLQPTREAAYDYYMDCMAQTEAHPSSSTCCWNTTLSDKIAGRSTSRPRISSATRTSHQAGRSRQD